MFNKNSWYSTEETNFEISTSTNDYIPSTKTEYPSSGDDSYFHLTGQHTNENIYNKDYTQVRI